MFVVYAIIIVTWFLIRSNQGPKPIALLSVGLIISFIVALLASMPPILEIVVGENETLRVFSPVAYPFCIQQYRDYDVGLFSYSLSLGWPEGLPLIQTAALDDQSEYINYQHYAIGLYLGILLLLSMVILVGILTVIDRKGILVRNLPVISVVPVLVILQLSLILLLTSVYLLGSIVYGLGGLTVLIITLYITIREIKLGGFLKKEET